jgi:hypothetical protein
MALHIIQYPTGRFGFVGLVPAALAFEGSTEDMETARKCGPGLARKIAERNGRAFTTLVWDTEDEARKAATDLGYSV